MYEERWHHFVKVLFMVQWSLDNGPFWVASLCQIVFGSWIMYKTKTFLKTSHKGTLSIFFFEYQSHQFQYDSHKSDFTSIPNGQITCYDWMGKQFEIKPEISQVIFYSQRSTFWEVYGFCKGCNGSGELFRVIHSLRIIPRQLPRSDFNVMD